MNQTNKKTDEWHQENRKANKTAKILVHGFSQTSQLKELSYLHSVVNEQNFEAFITDIDTISELGLNEEKVILALNFPYKTIGPELELEILVSPYVRDLTNIKGLLLPINKFDLQNRRYDNIREYLIQIDAITDKETYIVTDIDSLYEYTDIVTILGMADPYGKFKNVLFGTKNLAEIQKLIKNAFLKPISYFTFDSNYNSGNNARAFESFMISGRTALGLLKNEKAS